MKERKTGLLIAILFIIIVVLVGIVLYAFVIRPAISGYVIKTQNQGINYVISSIVAQIQQQGYAQIPVGNQTLILVPYQPETQQAQG